MTYQELIKGLTFSERWEDKELKAVIRHLASLWCVRRESMEDRITRELKKRANVGGLNDHDRLLKLAETRNRLQFQADYKAYKAAHSTQGGLS